ncbi:modular serine protease-like isoform X1 [Epargyreus clarus]|uniref:modular serine protease-like isoform X1 n=1 Tax=Epargyreus clarus TaxID=520877 RepID=UPI003C2E9852
MVIVTTFIYFLGIFTTLAVGGKNVSSPGSGSCVMPVHPENGRYEVHGEISATPGKEFPSLSLHAICDEGYGVDGGDTAVCSYGFWSQEPPKCSRFCRLQPHHSVDYTCTRRIGNTDSTGPCGEIVFPGTTVVPECKRPFYHSTISNMHCLPSGVWDHVATCSAECGTNAPAGQELILDGKRMRHGELPWHAEIYRKNTKPYKQICGGSLTSKKTIITAAHCFWDDVDGKKPASMYAVALGKVYRPWGDTHDKDAQYSDVAEIHIPERFRGAASNFESDIAILILETEIEYNAFIRPVCVNFDFSVDFVDKQLQDGKLGKVASYCPTADGKIAQALSTVELPFVPFDQCFNESPPDFREYITPDKFCAGFKNGSLCNGDGGGGLAFPEYERGILRYYLRGIASVAPRNDFSPQPSGITSFTNILMHKNFIKQYTIYA